MKILLTDMVILYFGNGVEILLRALLQIMCDMNIKSYQNTFRINARVHFEARPFLERERGREYVLYKILILHF